MVDIRYKDGDREIEAANVSAEILCALVGAGLALAGVVVGGLLSRPGAQAALTAAAKDAARGRLE